MPLYSALCAAGYAVYALVACQMNEYTALGERQISFSVGVITFLVSLVMMLFLEPANILGMF